MPFFVTMISNNELSVPRSFILSLSNRPAVVIMSAAFRKRGCYSISGPGLRMPRSISLQRDHQLHHQVNLSFLPPYWCFADLLHHIIETPVPSLTHQNVFFVLLWQSALDFVYCLAVSSTPCTRDILKQFFHSRAYCKWYACCRVGPPFYPNPQFGVFYDSIVVRRRARRGC